MDSFVELLRGWFTPQLLSTVIRVAVIIVIGFPLVKFLSRVLGKSVKKKYSQQAEMIVKKLVYYVGLGIIIVTLMHEFGFQLSAILGAAGILGVAIGFASQTSVSNIISGIFLISERPFEIGDVIQIGSTVGIVLSVDLLSVKIRTFDNRFIRIPNEHIIKTETVNITRFPIRRMDLNIGVAYKEDIQRVIAILKDLAAKNPYCLEEPEPMIFFNEFGDSALMIRYALWFEKTDVINLKKTIMVDIKERFDAEGIEIPFPHISLYTGEATDPFPLTVKNNGNERQSADKI